MQNLKQLTHCIYHKSSPLWSNLCQLNPIQGFAPAPLYHIHLSDLQLTSDASCLTCSPLSLSLRHKCCPSTHLLSSLSPYVTNAVPVFTCSPLSLPTSQTLSQYSLALLSLSLRHKRCPSTHLLSSLSPYVTNAVPVLTCSPLSLPMSQMLSQYSLALLSLSLLRPSTRLLSSLSPYVINAVTVLTRAVRIKRPLCPRGCAQSPHLL